jgi:hypothetical protein
MSYKFTLGELVASLDLDLDLNLSFYTHFAKDLACILKKTEANKLEFRKIEESKIKIKIKIEIKRKT